MAAFRNHQCSQRHSSSNHLKKPAFQSRKKNRRLVHRMWRRLFLEALETRCLLASDLAAHGTEWINHDHSTPTLLAQDSSMPAMIAEGESNALVALGYQFFAVNPDGSIGRNLDPNPSDAIAEAVVDRGEEFIVRTTVQDLRSNPKGVYANYYNLRYTNRDGSATELLEVQWSDWNVLSINKTGRTGAFRLQYGDAVTDPIELIFHSGNNSLDATATAESIRTKIESLTSMGKGNVRVEPSLIFPADNASFENFVFEISFRNQRSRSDIVAPVITDNQLLPANGSVPVSITISDIAEANASSPLALFGALDFAPPTSQSYYFYNGPTGAYRDVDAINPATRILVDVGGFSNSSSIPNQPGSVFTSHDIRFRAADLGTIDFQFAVAASSSANGGNGILLYNGAFTNLTESQLVLANATVRVDPGVHCNNDVYSLEFGAGEVDLNVLENDTAATALAIRSVTPPSRGSVSVSSDGKKLYFTPDASSKESVIFTYEVTDTFGALGTAAVIIGFTDPNLVPTLDPLNDLSMKRNAAETFVPLTGISAGGTESQPLRITSTSSDASVVPTPEVIYSSPNSTGSLRIKPKYDASGSAIITIFVEDGGPDADLNTKSDNKTIQRSFTVTVAQATNSHRNPRHRYDVDDNIFVSPLDIIQVLNLLNTKGPSFPVSELGDPPPYPDVDADGVISPIDALLVNDYLNSSGDGNGDTEGQVMSLEYVITDAFGTPIEQTRVGETVYVNIIARDLRTPERGVWSSYSDLAFMNSDTTSAPRLAYRESTSPDEFRDGISPGELIDVGSSDGAKILQGVGGVNSRPSSRGPKAVSRVRFEAVGEGSVEFDLRPTDPNLRYLGNSLNLGSGSYLDRRQIKLPVAKSLSILPAVECAGDWYEVDNISPGIDLDVLSNDFAKSALTIASVTQPAHGSVSITSDGLKLHFVPDPLTTGSQSFSYTAMDASGNLGTATVSILLVDRSELPTLDPIGDFYLKYNAAEQFVLLTGITAGGTESQPLEIFAYSNNTNIIPEPEVQYSSPSTTGLLRFKPYHWESGSLDITIFVTDGGRDKDLSTWSDNKTFTRTFTVNVADPTTSHQNPRNLLDVNDDGIVDPQDLLGVVEPQNTKGPSFNVNELGAPPPYPDVDADGLISPLDALILADYLYVTSGGDDSDSGGSAPTLLELDYLFTNASGEPIEYVRVGESVYVNVVAKDVREDGDGIWSSYSDITFMNSDDNSSERLVYRETLPSSDFGNGASDGELIDLGSPDKAKTLQAFGGFSKVYGTNPLLQTVSRIRLEAVREGNVEFDLTPTDPNIRFLGNSLAVHSYDYLNRSEIKVPVSRSFEIRTDIEATGDAFSILEDTPTILNVLGNDRLPVSGTASIKRVTQPSNGVVVISDDAKSVQFSPEPNFAGEAIFTYELQNERGVTSEATVSVTVIAVNDAPTIDKVVDFSVPEDIGTFDLKLIGITAGGGESQPIRVTATSSHPEVISVVSLDYSSPDAIATATLSAQLVSIGSSSIEVLVKDGGLDLDLETESDNRTTLMVFVISLAPHAYDFGDAPSTAQSGFASNYPTLLMENGARHAKGSLLLGKLIDGEQDGIPTLNALGDDQRRWKDEDGIAFPLSIASDSGTTSKSTFIASPSQNGFIDAFIDFNQDGDWDDIHEKIVDSYPVLAGRNLITFDVPSGIESGITYARVRLSSTGGLASTGEAIDGEVEDYAVTITGVSTSNMRLNATQLSSHEIKVDGDQLLVLVDGVIRWEAPVSMVKSFTIHREDGEVISELKDFTKPLPGILLIDEKSSVIQLNVNVPDVDLSNNTTIGSLNVIDLTKQGPNSVSFNPDDIANLNKVATVSIVMSADDSLKTVTTWTAGPGKSVDGVYVQTYTFGTATLDVTTDRPWRNEVFRYDVDGDRTAVALDVLILINTINANLFPAGTLPSRLDSKQPGFLDPNGDNGVGPLDVLVVINYINSSKGNGEGEDEMNGAISIQAEGEKYTKSQDNIRGLSESSDWLFAQWANVADIDDWRPTSNRSRSTLKRL